MNQRERILAGGVLALVAAYALYYWYGKYGEALAERRGAVLEAQEQLADATETLVLGRSAVRKLEAWQDQSLPSNFEKSLSLYKAWLSAQAKEAGLTVSHIRPAAQMASSTAYRTVGYHVEAQGALDQVAAMLYEFYSSRQLHQITKLQLSRLPGSSELKVTLDVEALILPGATATDALPAGDSQRLKLASLADYQKVLSSRDLTAAYTPPRPERETTAQREAPAPPRFDDAEHAHFTATVGSGSGLQAWINVRTTGQTLQVVAGDSLQVGQFDGKVVSIEPLSLVVEADDRHFRVGLGQALRGGQEIAQQAAPDAADAPAPEPPAADAAAGAQAAFFEAPGS